MRYASAKSCFASYRYRGRGGGGRGGQCRQLVWNYGVPLMRDGQAGNERVFELQLVQLVASATSIKTSSRNNSR